MSSAGDPSPPAIPGGVQAAETTPGGRRAKAYALAGNVVPGLIFLAVLPSIRRSLDRELFDFYMLGWSSIGASAIFEMGIGRALTHFTGKRLSQGCADDLVAAWTYLWVLSAVLVVGVAITAVTVTRNIGPSGVSGMAWVGLIATIPLGVMTGGYRGVIEGALHFGGGAVLRAFTVLALLFIPWAAGACGGTLAAVSLGFLAARLAVLIAHYLYEHHAIGLLRQRIQRTRESMRRVGQFVASVAVATSIGTLLGYLDRVMLASRAMETSAADYLVPFELASRVTIIPATISSVLFAVVSSTSAGRSMRDNIMRSHVTVITFVFPVMAGLVIFAGPILATWLQTEPSPTAVHVLQLLAIGVAFNSVAQVALAATQASGGERMVVWIYAGELIPAVLIMWWAFHRFGLEGLAAAWAVRCIVDCAALLVAQGRLRMSPRMR